MHTPPMTITTIPITDIVLDRRCQSRVGIDDSLVREYVADIRAGATMPPLATIRTPEGEHILYDGFHRLEAYRRLGVSEVEVACDDGDVWEAIARSCAVNADHGKRRTNADKRRAVAMMFAVMKHTGGNWTNTEIARRCGVSESLVRTSRANFAPNEDGPRTVTRNSTTYQMDTANIGKVCGPGHNTSAAGADDLIEGAAVDLPDPAPQLSGGPRVQPASAPAAPDLPDGDGAWDADACPPASATECQAMLDAIHAFRAALHPDGGNCRVESEALVGHLAATATPEEIALIVECTQEIQWWCEDVLIESHGQGVGPLLGARRS